MSTMIIKDSVKMNLIKLLKKKPEQSRNIVKELKYLTGMSDVFGCYSLSDNICGQEE